MGEPKKTLQIFIKNEAILKPFLFCKGETEHICEVVYLKIIPKLQIYIFPIIVTFRSIITLFTYIISYLY